MIDQRRLFFAIIYVNLSSLSTGCSMKLGKQTTDRRKPGVIDAIV